MKEQLERTSPPPPLPVRVIGKALTRMVARAPWTWPLMRRLVRGFVDRSAGGWDARVRPDAPEHLAALAAAVARLEAPPARALDLGTGTGASAVAGARVSRGARHGPGHLGGDDRAGEGEASERVVRPRRIPSRRHRAAALPRGLPGPGGLDQGAGLFRRGGAGARHARLRGRCQQPWAEDAVPHPGGHHAQGLPPTRDRDCRDRGGGPRHILCGQALGLKRRPSDETACRRGAMLASGAGVNSKGSAAWRPAAERR
jgi:hypothetical protein